ncbi:MAG: branched-chain amino acid transaminase [Myxococcota bacterium]
MPENTRIWMDGRMVDYADATTHVLSHSLHYGLGVFEGIRAYEQPDGSAGVFRLREHMDRLAKSCHIATLEIGHSVQGLCDATLQVLRENRLSDGYIRPIVWIGEGSVKVGATENRIHTAIAAWTWGAYLGDEALERGVRVCVSSYTRMGIRQNYEKAKITGQYVNSVFAKREANMNGFDEAILLDDRGFVAEGTGENLFLVREGELWTPPRGSSILAGITRDTLIRLARDEGLVVREEAFTRSDLYVSDEAFFCGTAAEVSPIREIDGRRIGIGRRGPITERLQKRYFEAARGLLPQYAEWITSA